MAPCANTEPTTLFAPIFAQALEARLSANASGCQELKSTAPETSEASAEAGGTELPENAGGAGVEHAPAATVMTVIVSPRIARTRLALIIAAREFGSDAALRASPSRHCRCRPLALPPDTSGSAARSSEQRVSGAVAHQRVTRIGAPPHATVAAGPVRLSRRAGAGTRRGRAPSRGPRRRSG